MWGIAVHSMGVCRVCGRLGYGAAERQVSEARTLLARSDVGTTHLHHCLSPPSTHLLLCPSAAPLQVLGGGQQQRHQAACRYPFAAPP